MKMTGMDAPQPQPQAGDSADPAPHRPPKHGAPVSAHVPRLAFLFRPAAALALLTGAVAVQLLTNLPPMWIDAAVGFTGLLLMLRRGWVIWLGLVLLGAAWTMLRADVALSQRLAPGLEGQDLIVTGAVRGLPRVAEDATRFDFAVQSAGGDESSPVTGILRLSWRDAAPTIEPCSIWRLHVRLRRPRGMIDPGAFDFERYALSEGISATGYIRDDAGNGAQGRSLFCVDRLRSRITAGIASTLGPGPSADLLRALAFGDQHAMDEHEWAVARATGIPHLIAISGLHIALFASFGVWFVRLLWKLAPRLTLRWPAPLIEAAASIVFAMSYAVLAGLGLPTRRALVMIGVLLAATLLRRARAPVHGLAFAVIALLVFDPLCVLSAGFWLSFVGVAWLMLCLGGHGERQRWWREAFNAQGVASLGLLPLTIWFFGQSSLVGPLANLIAVPWICFVVLPFGVVGALVQLALPAIGAPLVLFAGYALQGLWWLLERMAAWPGALWYFPEPALWAFALAFLGAFWLLLPRGMPARGLGVVLLLPLLVPIRGELRRGEFEALMLDVGQGLAIIVRTADHALVYDAGARFPSGFDLGDASVVPALHALGITASGTAHHQSWRQRPCRWRGLGARGISANAGRIGRARAPDDCLHAVPRRRVVGVEWRELPHRASTRAPGNARERPLLRARSTQRQQSIGSYRRYHFNGRRRGCRGFERGRQSSGRAGPASRQPDFVQ